MNSKFFLLLLVAALFSCNEEISVGSSLLDDGSIDLEYNDSVLLTGYSRFGDAPVVFRNVSTFVNSTYLVGELDDPVFGRSSSELYFSSNIIDQVFPLFDTLTIDSVILVLPLDTLGEYGNPEAIHNISVYQLSEELIVETNDTIRSDQQFDFEMMPLAQVSIKVDARDTVEYFNPRNDTIIQALPQLRIPMDINFWSQVAEDTLINRIDDAYSAFVKGFLVRSEPSESAMFGVDLSASSPVGVEFYYSSNDTSQFVYLFDLANIRSTYFEHDYMGTDIPTAVEDSLSDIWYMQDMRGPELVVDLAGVLNFSNEIINRAVIELPVLYEENAIVDPIAFLQAGYIDDEGRKSAILDYALAGSSFIDVFGGRLDSTEVDGKKYFLYNIDVTNHVNAIIAGDVNSSEVILESPFRSQRANRSIVLGPENPEYPARLKLVTSNP